MDFPLYELTLKAERPPQLFRVSPATLQSMVRALIDLLVEQQISATLWVKLPPGEIWQAEVQRYTEQIIAGTIYTCHSEKKAADEKTNSPEVELPDPSGVVSIQLAPESQLKREYFLVVLSPQFYGLILAHQFPAKRQSGKAEKADLKKTQLRTMATCSFERAVVQTVLEGIKQEIVPSQSQNIPAELGWDASDCLPPDPALLGQLLAKQIQRQDEIWRSATADRTATTLQLQNEELLSTMQMKDEFLSTLCEELRTPLTHIKTALSLLNSPQLKPAQRQRYMELLNTECDRQNSLITGLLDLVQLNLVTEHTALQPVRLSDIVPGVVSTYQPLAQEKGIMLAYTIPTDIPPVSCLSGWVKQIVINLLHNSIKFTPTGGQVWVRAGLQGDYVQLEFRDTGIGIPPSEIPKVFDRFYRVRPVAGEDPGGAGLGLTIVQQLLLRCGGSIAIKSKLGEGSVFNVLFPVPPAALGDEG